MRSNDPIHPAALGLAVLLAALSLASAGCGPPAVAPANQHLTSSLRTAVSAQNSEWLERNWAHIETRRTAGEMSDDEYEAFRAIVDTARAGNWEAAEKAVVRLQKAQRPTPEQLERLPRRSGKR